MRQTVSRHPSSDSPRIDASARRQELAQFLRARRESLSPELVGLPQTARRRVKGLRREEVAEAAGISTAWYTWMEQGRELHVSPATLKGLCEALNLTSQEQGHVYELSGLALSRTLTVPDAEAMRPVEHMVRGMDPQPAYALNGFWDIVAWNQSTAPLFGNLAGAPPAERNYLRLVFLNPRLRALLGNWEEAARCALAHFRLDSVGLVEDPRWTALIHELRHESDPFRLWWSQHNVVWPRSTRKELRLPEGPRIYRSYDMELSTPARLRLVAYLPWA